MLRKKQFLVVKKELWQKMQMFAESYMLGNRRRALLTNSTLCLCSAVLHEQLCWEKQQGE